MLLPCLRAGIACSSSQKDQKSVWHAEIHANQGGYGRPAGSDSEQVLRSRPLLLPGLQRWKRQHRELQTMQEAVACTAPRLKISPPTSQASDSSRSFPPTHYIIHEAVKAKAHPTCISIAKLGLQVPWRKDCPPKASLSAGNLPSCEVRSSSTQCSTTQQSLWHQWKQAAFCG